MGGVVEKVDFADTFLYLVPVVGPLVRSMRLSTKHSLCTYHSMLFFFTYSSLLDYQLDVSPLGGAGLDANCHLAVRWTSSTSIELFQAF